MVCNVSMKLPKMGTKGLMSAGAITGVLVTIFVVFILASVFLPLVLDSGDDLNETIAGKSATLDRIGGLFASSGIVVILIMVGLLLGILAGLGFMKGGTKRLGLFPKRINPIRGEGATPSLSLF